MKDMKDFIFLESVFVIALSVSGFLGAWNIFAGLAVLCVLPLFWFAVIGIFIHALGLEVFIEAFGSTHSATEEAPPQEADT